MAPTQHSDLLAEPRFDTSERYLIAMLHGAPLPHNSAWAAQHVDEIIERAEFHGISALAHQQITEHPGKEALPNVLVERLRIHAHKAAAREMLLRPALVRALERLHRAGFRYLLLKGTALAYSHYPHPYLRERCDTDILFASKDEAQKAGRLLEAHGFTPGSSVEGDVYSYQKSYLQDLPVGAPLMFDVHWQDFNNNVYGGRLDFETLSTHAVSVPGLGSHVRAPGVAESFIYAAVHRLGHAAEGLANRLIWLYDFSLLVEALEREAWSGLVDQAKSLGVAHACLDAIRAARMTFEIKIPTDCESSLRDAANIENVSSAFLKGELSAALGNVLALPGWQSRARLIRQHLFPAPSYLFTKYQARSRLALPWLYARRILSGLARLRKAK